MGLLKWNLGLQNNNKIKLTACLYVILGSVGKHLSGTLNCIISAPIDIILIY